MPVFSLDRKGKDRIARYVIRNRVTGAIEQGGDGPKGWGLGGVVFHGGGIIRAVESRQHRGLAIPDFREREALALIRINRRGKGSTGRSMMAAGH